MANGDSLELSAARLQWSIAEAVRRAVEYIRGSRFEVNLTDLLRCQRLYWYEHSPRINGDSRNELEASRIDLQMALGTLIHELLEIDGCVKELEMRICRRDVCIVAKPDFWCPASSTVIEVKTIARLANIPRLNHIAQLKTYMTLLNAERGVLLYISRTSGEVKTFEFRNERDFGIIDALFERAEAYRRYLASRSPPEPEPGIWCRNCPYRNACGAKIDEARMGETWLNSLLKRVAGRDVKNRES